jgi:protocatechuate 3,4-dioxygenase, beta subunit
MPSAYDREAVDVHPPYAYPAYVSTHRRAPAHEPIRIEQSLSEITGPLFGRESLRPGDEDLTLFDGGEAIGERIIVGGRVVDENGRAIPATLIEIWQANAAGRYAHDSDRHDAPLDPHFCGVGRAFTDADGRYRFVTIRPGAYPWRNHDNAWRPAHIHFSILGPSFASRLITQMYFTGDPLLSFDPIFNSVPGADARQRLIANLDPELTVAEHALGYRFDIVLRGRTATPMEP